MLVLVTSTLLRHTLPASDPKSSRIAVFSSNSTRMLSRKPSACSELSEMMMG